MLVSLHITHTSAGGMECLGGIISGLGDAISEALSGSEDAKEYVVIRTCNRLEAYVSADDNQAVRMLMEETVRKSVPFADREFWYILQDRDCIKHLFTVVCGIDSLIVGEDQIQHQIRDAFMNARREGHVGKSLYALFNNAIVVGKRVRTETDLNKGAVSVGYAAIELAEKDIGSLNGKNIAIVGAGDMAGIIAKNLAGKGPETVFVSNRTFERAQELARELDGTAVTLDRLGDMMAKSDLVLVATSAKHPVITREMAEKAMCQRPERPLLIIDVSVPVNVAEEVAGIPNVKLSTMASLDAIATENVARRKKEIGAAERIIRQEMEKIDDERKIRDANATIREMGIMCERIRSDEAAMARSRLDNGDSPSDVIDCMSHAIVKMISAEFIKNLRKAALGGDSATVEAAAKLFGLRPDRAAERSDCTDVSDKQGKKTQTDTGDQVPRTRDETGSFRPHPPRILRCPH